MVDRESLLTTGFAREREKDECFKKREKSLLRLLGVFLPVKRKISTSSEMGEVEDRERRKEKKEK